VRVEREDFSNHANGRTHVENTARTYAPIFIHEQNAQITHSGVGCIVDGVPPRMQLTEEEIQIQLDRRRPGQAGAGAISTGRNEADAVQILSGSISLSQRRSACSALSFPISLLYRRRVSFSVPDPSS